MKTCASVGLSAALATRLLSCKGAEKAKENGVDIAAINLKYGQGLGEIDLTKIRVEEVVV